MDDALTLVIADDHPLFRKGVAEVLTSDPAIRVVGEAADGEDALRKIRALSPRVAVLDVNMPKMTGLDVAKAVRAESLPVTLVLLTAHAGADLLQQALSLGVQGYVSKESAADDILACVHLVASGRTYVSASLGKSAAAALTPPPSPGLAHLTPSERAVLKLVANNRSTKDVAEHLGITPKTVENHRSNICQKLGVTGNNALVRFAMEHAGEIQGL